MASVNTGDLEPGCLGRSDPGFRAGSLSGSVQSHGYNHTLLSVQAGEGEEDRLRFEALKGKGQCCY